jgi:hypothetical protein
VARGRDELGVIGHRSLVIGHPRPTADDNRQATSKKRKLPPWLGSFLLCFGDPSWSQGPKRLEALGPIVADLPRGERREELLLRLGRLLGRLFGGLLSRSFLCHGAVTSFLDNKFSAQAKIGQ